MDEKDKELLTLQFSRMEEMIHSIALDTQETKADVKESKKDIKELDKRVRDIEEIVRNKDSNDKLISTRLEKLERKTSIVGFFVDNPKLFWVVVLALCIVVLNGKSIFEVLSFIK